MDGWAKGGDGSLWCRGRVLGKLARDGGVVCWLVVHGEGCAIMDVVAAAVCCGGNAARDEQLVGGEWKMAAWVGGLAGWLAGMRASMASW